MFRQIIVFTKSPSLPTVHALHTATKDLNLLFTPFNPFSDLTLGLPQDSIKDLFENGLGEKTLILPRTSGILFDDIDLTLARQCRSFGATLTHDPEHLSLIRNKDHQSFWLTQAGLPMVPTLLKRGELTERDLQFCDKPERWVIKSVRGNRGIGQHLFDQGQLLSFWDRALETQDQRYLIQPFWENAKEIRLIALGEKTYFLEKMPGTDWRKNSDHSEFKVYEPEKKEKDQLMQIGETISKELGFKTFAIDLLRKEDQSEWHILEVNAHPGLSHASACLGQQIFKEFWLAYL